MFADFRPEEYLLFFIVRQGKKAHSEFRGKHCFELILSELSDWTAEKQNLSSWTKDLRYSELPNGSFCSESQNKIA